MKTMRLILAAASLLAVGACAPTVKAPSDTLTVLEPGEGGQCKIEDWQSFVGKPKQSLPTAPAGLVFRVLCSSCAATMDYRSDRVSFTYNDKDMITRASCG